MTWLDSEYPARALQLEIDREPPNHIIACMARVSILANQSPVSVISLNEDVENVKVRG